MAYEFMKLAEVEALEEVPENATVFAEVGGAVKRIPGSGLGGNSSGNNSVSAIIIKCLMEYDEGGDEFSLFEMNVPEGAAQDIINTLQSGYIPNVVFEITYTYDGDTHTYYSFPHYYEERNNKIECWVSFTNLNWLFSIQK